MVEIPVVYAKLKHNGLVFYCQYCSHIHYHSCEDGLRTAHCTKESSPYIKTGYYIKLRSLKDSYVSKKLRYKILKRDNFKCVYCGATSSEIKLTIDHKTPRSQGGKNTEENLVTACFDCNVGKGAQL